MNDDTPIADGTTRADLYERARTIDLPGRSGMSKAELAAALARHDRARHASSGGAAKQATGTDVADTSDGTGTTDGTGPVPAPRRLTGHDRRLHVRRTLREGPVSPASNEGPAFGSLTDSPLAFFRGTSRLFERDRAGDGAGMPVVAVRAGVPLLDGGDDLDPAPFTRDLERAATAFLLAAEEMVGASEDRAHKIARRFLRAYLDTLQELAADGDGSKPSKRRASGHGDAIDPETLDAKGWKRFARRCGRTLAREHARPDPSNEHGAGTGAGMAPRIVAAVGAHRLFIDDTLHIAHETGMRARRDHELFVRDHQLGAFEKDEPGPD